MRRVALKGLLGRKLRATLTAIAIVLGVAMVSGTFVLTDTIEKAVRLDLLRARTSRRTPSSAARSSSTGRRAARRRSPADVLAKVRALPEVDAAAGTILDLSGDSNQAKILDRNGKVIQGNNPTFGLGIDAAGRAVQPLQARRGRLGGRSAARS